MGLRKAHKLRIPWRPILSDILIAEPPLHVHPPGLVETDPHPLHDPGNLPLGHLVETLPLIGTVDVLLQVEVCRGEAGLDVGLEGGGEAGVDVVRDREAGEPVGAGQVDCCDECSVSDECSDRGKTEWRELGNVVGQISWRQGLGRHTDKEEEDGKGEGVEEIAGHGWFTFGRLGKSFPHNEARR